MPDESNRAGNFGPHNPSNTTVNIKRDGTRGGQAPEMAAVPRITSISFRYRLAGVLPFHLGLMAGQYRIVPWPDGSAVQFTD